MSHILIEERGTGGSSALRGHWGQRPTEARFLPDTELQVDPELRLRVCLAVTRSTMGATPSAN